MSSYTRVPHTFLPADVARWGLGLEDSLARDAWSSDWSSSGGATWGGRSRGGRGVKSASLGRDISIDGLDISFDGQSALLSNVSIKLEQGRKYALIGENGAGKSTLLRRIALGAIPGWPSHIRTHYLQQEDAKSLDASVTVLDEILGETESLLRLRVEEEELEAALGEEQQGSDGEGEDLLRLSEQLCNVVERIEIIEAAREAALDPKERLNVLPTEEREIIKGLGLTGLVGKSCALLSGGQRTRCALARALLAVSRRECDLLLLDEASNHLSAEHIEWLKTALASPTLGCILVAVSHDEEFLQAVCTDVYSIDHGSHTLTHFPGDFVAYERYLNEQQHYNEGRLDSQLRKEVHIEKSLQFARDKGLDSTIRNKEKKLQRASMSARSDGKKFHLFSLKKLDEESLRMPEVVSASKKLTSADHPFLFDAARVGAKGKAKLISFRFPEPAELRNDKRPLLTLRKCDVSWPWPTGSEPVLKQLSLEVSMGDRVAILGRNGSGKTTLMTALSRLLCASNAAQDGADICSGAVHVEPALTAGFVGQQHIDDLSANLLISPVDFLQQRLSATGKAGKWSDLEVRTHLGRLSLGGSVALQPIGAMSGGEKARLAFAAACLSSPQVLLLDEPTNHLSHASLAALMEACQGFSGAILFSTHSTAFVEEVATHTLKIESGVGVVAVVVPSSK